MEDWRVPGFEAVLDVLLAERATVHLVGGVVRDALLERPGPVADLDLAVEPPALPLARRVADRLGWAFYALDPERDVARLVQGTEGQERVCDIAGLRGSLAEDLLARDLTVNALAVTLHRDGRAELVDPGRGLEDLAAGRLRRVTDRSLGDDPLRLLRAVRLAVQLDFALEPATAHQIRALAPRILQASPERLRDELWKSLASPRPHRAIELARSLGLLEHVLPEVASLAGVEQGPPHHLDVYRHTLLAMQHAGTLRAWLGGQQAALPPQVEALLQPWRAELAAHFAAELAHGHTRAGWLPWHALLHDLGKPLTRSLEPGEDAGKPPHIRFLGHEAVSEELAARRLLALRFARREVDVARRVAASHMRPHHLAASFPQGTVSRRAAFRFFRAAATAGPDDHTGLDVLLLALADALATGQNVGSAAQASLLSCIASLLDYALRLAPQAGPPLVNGRVLMQALGLEPGPQIGRILHALAEAQASGRVTTVDEALALARQLAENERQQALGDE